MADYTLDELYAKLERAKAAGPQGLEAGKVIADEIRRMESGGEAPEVADFTGTVHGSSPTVAEAPPAPAKPQSLWENLNTPMEMPKGMAEIVPENPYLNKVAFSLFSPVGNFAAGAERKLAGAVRGGRQVLNEYLLNDPEKLAELQADEEAARVRDEALFKTPAGRRGSYFGTAMSMFAPLGAVGKAGQLAKAPAIVRALASGATAAGVTGLTTPTVKGESRKGPMTASGIVGALGPLAGPLLKLGGKFIPERVASTAKDIFTGATGDRIKREAGKQIGKITDALEISPAVLAKALRRVDPRLPQDVQDTIRKVLVVGAKPKPGAIKIPNASTIPGRVVQLQRKEAGNVSRSIQLAEKRGTASVADIRTKNAYEDLIGQLDEAVADTLKNRGATRTLKQLEAARKQFRTGERPFGAGEVVRKGALPAFLQYGFAPEPKKPTRKKEK